MESGIIGYGVAIPSSRISVSEIAKVWGKSGEKIFSSLGVVEKAVAGFDEDSCTLAVEAARNAVEHSGIYPVKINAIFVGSESKPYAVKPTASTVAEALGATPLLTAADLEFACKAGTTGIQACLGMCESGLIEYGMAIGADTAQGRPGDALEYSTGCGAAAFLVGKNGVIASVDATESFTTDTPDFWRRQTAEFPRHGGRFTGKPAYFKHVVGAARALFEKRGLSAKDFDYAVFHQPNGRFPLEAGKSLGFEKEKLAQGLVTPFIGNTYSASTLIGLAAILDVAKPREKILAVSYGSGAGADAFEITVSEKILEKPQTKKVFNLINEEKHYIDYGSYVKYRRKLKNL